MSQAIIEVKGISKSFSIGKQRSADLRSSLMHMFSMTRSKNQEILALNNVSFKVEEGEIFGIIGPNGSGKSTLLKILSRITSPSAGEAIIRGKVSSLLEVGTGFHPELTGRENIFLNGSILGMKRQEIRSSFDEIVSFSGVETFLDTPVKHYSSGMYVRLAFSVAAYLNPDILLVDEVLSVGDMAFREKSIRKMNEVTNSGKTILFVSHDLETIQQLCTKGILLKNGTIDSIGPMTNVINAYKAGGSTNFSEIQKTSFQDGFEISHLRINELDVNAGIKIKSGEDLNISFHFNNKHNKDHVTFKLEVKNEQSFTLFVCNNFLTGDHLTTKSINGEALCKIPKLPLNTGNYYISMTVLINDEVVFMNSKLAVLEVMAGMFFKTGFMPSGEKMFLADHSWNFK